MGGDQAEREIRQRGREGEKEERTIERESAVRKRPA